MDKESKRTLFVAKGSNQVMSGIGRSRSLRLDSTMLGPGDQDEAYLRDKFALGKILVQLIVAVDFIKFGFGTLVEPRSWGTRYS